MKKPYCFLFSALLMVACLDDNSSSADSDELGSSSEENLSGLSSDETNISSSSGKTSISSSSNGTHIRSSSNKKENLSSSNGIFSGNGWITAEYTEYFSFFDEKHLRYNLIDEECDYDSTTNTFKWVTGDYIGAFDWSSEYNRSELEERFGGDSLKLLIHNSFGYKMSNDTLYECYYIENVCDSIDVANVYVGSSKSIFSTWERVGSIVRGEFTEVPSFAKSSLTLTPRQRTITSSYNSNNAFITTDYCDIIQTLFVDKEQTDLCVNHLKTFNQQPTDTIFISEIMWIFVTGKNVATISVNNRIFEASIDFVLEKNPSQIFTHTQKITYQGTTCTWWQKNIDITQEYCETGDHSSDLIEYKYSYFHREYVNQLQTYSGNQDEFEECIKQFNLR